MILREMPNWKALRPDFVQVSGLKILKLFKKFLE